MKDTNNSYLSDLTDKVKVVSSKKIKIINDLKDPNEDKLIHMLEVHLNIFA